MKSIVNKLLAVMLALVLVLSLAACGDKENNDNGKDTDDPHADNISDITPSKDPAGYISAAASATMADLAERYSGSPIAALSKLSGSSGSATFSLSASQDGETVALGGNLGFDMDAGKLLLEASIGYMGESIDAGLYLDKDYLGVSVPMLLGEGAYYGFVPHDLYDQVSGSALGQYMDEESLEAFKEIDKMLESFSGIDPSDMEKYSEELEKLFRDFAASIELTANADGDGWVISGTVTVDQIADLYEDIMDVVLDSSALGALSDIAASSGESVDIEGMRSQISESLQELRDTGGKLDVNYYISGDKLTKIVLVPQGDNVPEGNNITVDLGDKITVSVLSEGSDTVTLTSEVKSDKGSYKHTLTMTADGETMTVAADWTDNRLDLSMTTNGETLLSLTGDFGVSEDGFYLTGGKLTADGMDGEALGLEVKYTSGGTVETPANLNNIFTMSEQELTDLILSIASLAGLTE